MNMYFCLQLLLEQRRPIGPSNLHARSFGRSFFACKISIGSLLYDLFQVKSVLQQLAGVNSNPVNGLTEAARLLRGILDVPLVR